MNANNQKNKIAVLTLISLTFFAFLVSCSTSTVRKNYTSQPRSDGGVSIQITGVKRYLTPISAEGPFPKQSISFNLELIGPGKSWSYRNQEGFYYAAEEIFSNKRHWDLGYAWMDKDRKHVTLNLYWVRSPNSLIPADINGRYEVARKADPKSE